LLRGRDSDEDAKHADGKRSRILSDKFLFC
jgi:hypothetical protein